MRQTLILAAALFCASALAGTPPPTTLPPPPTLPPTPCGDNCGPNDVTPLLRCACRLNADEVYAQFDYTNTNANTVVIAAGTARNYMTPGAAAQGQPSSFAPGSHFAHSVIYNCTAHPSGEAWVVQQLTVVSALAPCVTASCTNSNCGSSPFGVDAVNLITDENVAAGDAVRIVHNTTDQARAHVRKIRRTTQVADQFAPHWPLRYVNDPPPNLISPPSSGPYHRQTVFAEFDLQSRFFFVPTFETCVAADGSVGYTGVITSLIEPPYDGIVNVTVRGMPTLFQLGNMGPFFQGSPPIWMAAFFMIVDGPTDEVVHFETFGYDNFDHTYESAYSQRGLESYGPFFRGQLTSVEIAQCVVSSRKQFWLYYDEDPIKNRFMLNIPASRNRKSYVRAYNGITGELLSSGVLESTINPLGTLNHPSFENHYPYVLTFQAKTRTVLPAPGSNGTIVEQIALVGSVLSVLGVHGTAGSEPAHKNHESATLVILGQSNSNPAQLVISRASFIQCTIPVFLVVGQNTILQEYFGDPFAHFVGAGARGIAVLADGDIIISGIAAGDLYVPFSSTNGLNAQAFPFAQRRIKVPLAERDPAFSKIPYTYLARYSVLGDRWTWVTYPSGTNFNPSLQFHMQSMVAMQKSNTIAIPVDVELKYIQTPGRTLNFTIGSLVLPNPTDYSDINIVTFDASTGAPLALIEIEDAKSFYYNQAIDSNSAGPGQQTIELAVNQDDSLFFTCAMPLSAEQLDSGSPAWISASQNVFFGDPLFIVTEFTAYSETTTTTASRRRSDAARSEARTPAPVYEKAYIQTESGAIYTVDIGRPYNASSPPPPPSVSRNLPGSINTSVCDVFVNKYDPADYGFSLAPPFVGPGFPNDWPFAVASPVNGLYHIGDIVPDLTLQGVFTGNGAGDGLNALSLGNITFSYVRNVLHKRWLYVCECPLWCEFCQGKDGHWGLNAVLNTGVQDAGITADQRVELGAVAPNVFFMSGMSQAEQSVFSTDYSVAGPQYIAAMHMNATNVGDFNDVNFQLTGLFNPNPTAFPWCFIIDLASGQWVYSLSGGSSARETCLAEALAHNNLGLLPAMSVQDLTNTVGAAASLDNGPFYMAVVHIDKTLTVRGVAALAGPRYTGVACDAQGNVYVNGITSPIFSAHPNYADSRFTNVQVLQMNEDSAEIDELACIALESAVAGSTVAVDCGTSEISLVSSNTSFVPGQRVWWNAQTSSYVQYPERRTRFTGYATSPSSMLRGA